MLSFSVNAQTGDSLLNQLSRKWLNAKAYTLQLAERMPDNNYTYKPVHEVMSFKEQLLHMAANIQWLSSTYLFSKKDDLKIDTANMDKPALIKHIAQVYDRALAAHYHLTEKQLNEVIPFFAGTMTRRQVLVLLHDHQTHHAGQLILYLRLNGIKPPNYIGW